jgi:hypothetical protein
MVNLKAKEDRDEQFFALLVKCLEKKRFGVSEGNRTPNLRIHSPML